MEYRAMSDNSPSESEDWDASAVQRWLEQLAESRDLTEDEVLQELASSLWMLDELESMMAETDLNEALPRGAPSGRNQFKSSGSGEDAASLDVDLAALDEDVDTLDDRVDSLATAIEAVESRFETFEDETGEDLDNAEQVLHYLVDRTDDLADRVSTTETRLAAVTSTVEAWQRQRTSLQDLYETANDHGITKAVCDRCDNTVQFATLVAPSCPKCTATFDELSPKSGLFGSNRLLTAPDDDLPDRSPVDVDPENLPASPDGTRTSREPPENPPSDTNEDGNGNGDEGRFIWDTDG